MSGPILGGRGVVPGATQLAWKLCNQSESVSTVSNPLRSGTSIGSKPSTWSVLTMVSIESGRDTSPDTLTSVNTALGALLQSIQEADVVPNTATIAAVVERRAALAKLLQRWSVLKGR
ncbi:MAG: hypothetical protein M3Y27_27535 [Acidobacteriota bacterium]|nr:hypothetical protein [Acidobacteriota bacterium]